jgi:elongator complex protein 1
MFRKKNHSVKWDSALEFVCWLVDANRIYEVALGTYDFELVKLVAQYTQKDPKEYIPYLESLNLIPNEIDM